MGWVNDKGGSAVKKLRDGGKVEEVGPFGVKGGFLSKKKKKERKEKQKLRRYRRKMDREYGKGNWDV